MHLKKIEKIRWLENQGKKLKLGKDIQKSVNGNIIDLCLEKHKVLADEK